MINSLRRERIEDIKKILSAVSEGGLDMCNWHDISSEPGRNCNLSTKELSINFETYHTCGNKACIAGYVGLSPIFQEAGGITTPYLGPKFEDYDFGIESMAAWFNISEEMSELVFTGFSEPHNVDVFGWYRWNTKDAIKALNYLLKYAELSDEFPDDDYSVRLFDDLCSIKD